MTVPNPQTLKDVRAGQAISATDENNIRAIVRALGTRLDIGGHSLAGSRAVAPAQRVKLGIIDEDNQTLPTDHTYFVRVLSRHAQFVKRPAPEKAGPFKPTASGSFEFTGSTAAAKAANLAEMFPVPGGSVFTTHRLPKGTPVVLFEIDGMWFFFCPPVCEFDAQLGASPTQISGKYVITIGDTPANGETFTYTATVDAGADTATYTATVPSDDAAAVATGLAAAINAKVGDPWGDITASASGAKVTIIIDSSDRSTDDPIASSSGGTGASTNASYGYRWAYAFTELKLDGFKWATPAGTQRTGTAYNGYEHPNDGTGTEGNGVNINAPVADPTTTDEVKLLPVSEGTPVVRIRGEIDKNGDWAYSFCQPNPVSVTCATG